MRGFMNGFRMGSHIDACMESEWIRNGFIQLFQNGFRTDPHIDSEWIHTWIHNGIQKEAVRVACWDNWPILFASPVEITESDNSEIACYF